MHTMHLNDSSNLNYGATRKSNIIEKSISRKLEKPTHVNVNKKYINKQMPRKF